MIPKMLYGLFVHTTERPVNENTRMIQFFFIYSCIRSCYTDCKQKVKITKLSVSFYNKFS